ncbi:MAG: hypothetical protein U5N86_03675 [Planctomycetota bacterium]|nr:hypothetical protein [Planctomycetota bacterium]
MKEQWPLFAAVLIAVLFIVGANYALPQPAPPPVKMSTASVPTSVKPTPKPTPRPVPSYRDSLANADEFKPGTHPTLVSCLTITSRWS